VLVERQGLARLLARLTLEESLLGLDWGFGDLFPLGETGRKLKSSSVSANEGGEGGSKVSWEELIVDSSLDLTSLSDFSFTLIGFSL